MWRDREPQPEPTSKDNETQRKITHFVSRRIVIIARPNVIIISVVPSLIIVVFVIVAVGIVVSLFSFYGNIFNRSIDTHFFRLFIFILSFLFRFLRSKQPLDFEFRLLLLWLWLFVGWLRYFENLKHLRRC